LHPGLDAYIVTPMQSGAFQKIRLYCGEIPRTAIQPIRPSIRVPIRNWVVPTTPAAEPPDDFSPAFQGRVPFKAGKTDDCKTVRRGSDA
jgi:hypothetical protein